MDGIADVAQRQQSQIHTTEIQGRTTQVVSQTDVASELPKESLVAEPKINSKEQVEELVSQLNKALEPMSTNLKFGVDSEDIFYVSVIESETSKMIRRFPAEEAAAFLPKMQEVSGILFDSRG